MNLTTCIPQPTSDFWVGKASGPYYSYELCHVKTLNNKTYSHTHYREVGQ